MFLHAAMIHNIEPAKSMVVEDSPTGVLAAKAAGMYAVGFTGAHYEQELAEKSLKDAGADIVVDDYNDILAIIKNN